ncbi:glutamine amidotransferase [Xanthomonas sp. LF06-19]|uniref:glutamine amidotransferase n=1 Tax=Xanthomonas sp. LF06-19 TaxID=3097551 RepID=UPI002A80FEAE|nr:glutamine amidotransferase [Xanthomonas sp. LF06-19]MDY4283025.1 glutamine amidotransferase [Xanthomonas sp. LF06-19]
MPFASPVRRRAAPFLILETGEPVATMRRYGRFPHWIRVAAGLAERETVVTNVVAGEALPARGDFAGVIVTGSAAFVTDRAEWSERSAAWLREAAEDGTPMLGICYGHQLLAHALGGEVAYNPAGRESGTVDIELHPPAAEDPLFAGLPPRFPAHATHLQTVLRAPSGATVLAHSAQDQCHAFRWGEATWGVQFHPEFATHHMRGYVQARADCLRSAGRCARTIAREVSAAPLARKLLRRFVQHARGQHSSGQAKPR